MVLNRKCPGIPGIYVYHWFAIKKIKMQRCSVAKALVPLLQVAEKVTSMDTCNFVVGAM